MRRFLVTVSVVPGSPILVTLMKEALYSSETSVLTRATWRNIPEDAILQGCRPLLEQKHFTVALSSGKSTLKFGHDTSVDIRISSITRFPRE
jgi:hypothetical protein